MDPLGIRFLNVEYYFAKVADLFGAIFGYLFGYNASGTIDVYNQTGSGAVAISQNTGQVFHIVLFFIGFTFFVCICYFLYLSYEIRQEEVSHVEHWNAPVAPVEKVNPRLVRWEKIVGLFNSSDQAQWRLAVIESDVMLDELMQYLGFDGANLGERLKSTSVRVFPPLRDAWEVHNLRNRLAHEGMGYEITIDEIRRARKIYENIFRGYSFI